MRRESTLNTETESAYYSYAADTSLVKRLVQPSATATYYFYDNNGARTAMVEGGSPTYYQYGPHGFITAIAPPSSRQLIAKQALELELRKKVRALEEGRRL